MGIGNRVGDVTHVRKEIPRVRVRCGTSKSRVGRRARLDVEKGGDDACVRLYGGDVTTGFIVVQDSERARREALGRKRVRMSRKGRIYDVGLDMQIPLVFGRWC